MEFENFLQLVVLWWLLCALRIRYNVDRVTHLIRVWTSYPVLLLVNPISVAGRVPLGWAFYSHFKH